MFGMRRVWGLTLLASAVISGGARGQSEETTALRQAEVKAIDRRVEAVIDLQTTKVQDTAAVQRGLNEISLEYVAAKQDPQALARYVDVLSNSFATLDRGQNGGEDISLVKADTPLRVQLKLPEGQGLVVLGLAQGGQAAATGLSVNDILLTIDGKALGEPEDLAKNLKAAGEKAIELKLLHHGQAKTLRVKPLYHVSLAPAEPEPPAFFIGVQAEEINGILRDHLHLGEQKGLVAGDVIAESPAAKAGVLKGDILLEFAEKPLADVETLVGQVQAHGGKPTVLKVLRAGKPEVIAVTPERRKPEPEANQANVSYTVDVLSRLQPVTFTGNTTNGVIYFQPQTEHLYQAHSTMAGAKPADPVEKRLEELNAEVKALHKAIEDLRKVIAEKK